MTGAQPPEILLEMLHWGWTRTAAAAGTQSADGDSRGCIVAPL